MNCNWTMTRADGTTKACKSAATDTGRCAFHSRDWQASHDRMAAETDAYRERTGRNLFLDRLAGEER